MPQHEMPFRDRADQTAFEALDEFTRGYVQAIFFTEWDNPELQDATFADLAPETLEKIRTGNCAAFQRDNAAALESVQDVRGKYEREDYNETRAGVDFWFTRNGHGAGYWDRGLGKAGDALSKAARAAGSRDVYAGDDGKVYLS